mmetsp:Transcript_26679/g.35060  ORF Transcript_26679/g.35060 Transcript_26679/m.35060 type:complete len:357 (+) Transcript_26679:66-1136(+)
MNYYLTKTRFNSSSWAKPLFFRRATLFGQRFRPTKVLGVEFHNKPYCGARKPVSHTVLAKDGHPLRVWEKNVKQHTGKESSPHNQPKNAILLLHGRTWSSLPVWDLHIPHSSSDDAPGGYNECLSFMDLLVESGYDAFAVDLRGFGETPLDGSMYLTPSKAVDDVHMVFQWLRGAQGYDNPRPYLLGWSYGGLVAQLFAQKYPDDISDLVLYGSAYDPSTIFPRPSLTKRMDKPKLQQNTEEAAIEDFTLPGSICNKAADAFAAAALASDPLKVIWSDLHEFNDLNAHHVHAPTLVIHGDMDPYTPIKAQRKLFTNLAASGDKVWQIIPYSDHCIHVLESRYKFLHGIMSFFERPK